ncbi:MAG: adenylate/guanylate cyclase domain-containing protein [Eudoraea sp.]|nr:adenylate/guanylate cyclase domain-containing protein [Eudoraea sp.]
MKLSPKTKRNIARIIPFGVIWLAVGWFNLFIEAAATGNKNLDPSAIITLTTEVFVFASIAVTLVGLLFGSIEVLWLGNLFSKRNFAQKIFFKTGFYTVFMLVIIGVMYPLAASVELQLTPLDTRVWQKFSNYLISLDFISTLVSLSFSLFLSLFYSEISQNIGHGVLINFFTGKYHSPTEEKRIFMFLDMKSSTTIAEQLGHIKYFELLKEYYADFSEAIVQYSGEIYQYVGDEIVISWKYKDGIANNNCLKCFFAMKAALLIKAPWYSSTFGLVPSFKAGLHYGIVTTGEIGALKKEIIFTGDVLNTTARIQGLCNELKVDLLVSEKLSKNFHLDSEFQIKPIGHRTLKGKEESLTLCTIL